jgi:hypothetical protein
MVVPPLDHYQLDLVGLTSDTIEEPCQVVGPLLARPYDHDRDARVVGRVVSRTESVQPFRRVVQESLDEGRLLTLE